MASYFVKQEAGGENNQIQAAAAVGLNVREGRKTVSHQKDPLNLQRFYHFIPLCTTLRTYPTPKQLCVKRKFAVSPRHPLAL